MPNCAGGQFAAWGICFSTFDCTFAHIRQKAGSAVVIVFHWIKTYKENMLYRGYFDWSLKKEKNALYFSAKCNNITICVWPELF